MNYRATRMEVNLKNLRHNFRVINDHVGKQTSLMAVVKADAYGHGAVTVAKTLIKEGCQRLAVAIPDEAIELRMAGIREPILVLGPSSYNVAGEYVRLGIECALTDIEFARCLNKEALKQNRIALVHLKVDTGLGRIGFLPGVVPEVVDEVVSMPGLKLYGLFTHFAVAGERRLDYSENQFRKFLKVLEMLEKKKIRISLKHVCNSGGMIHSPDMFLDAVRAGIILYGMWPSKDCRGSIDIMQTFEVKTEVALVRELPPYSGVGYGLRYLTRGYEQTAVLPIGYGDGYSRSLSMKADVLIHGRRAPVIGGICMDQTMVDITGISDVKIGDEVVIVGSQGDEIITPEELAALRGSVNYEVPISFLKRVPRIYIEE